MQVLLDLAAFIPVFEGLPGLMIRFAERMLRITDRVADDLDCFCHSTFHVGNLSGFAQPTSAPCSAHCSGQYPSAPDCFEIKTASPICHSKLSEIIFTPTSFRIELDSLSGVIRFLVMLPQQILSKIILEITPYGVNVIGPGLSIVVLQQKCRSLNTIVVAFTAI